MDAITSQLEALRLTSPERNTTCGKKQTSRHSYRCKRTSKAKYNAYHYKTHKYTINCEKAGNASERPGQKHATIKKRNIKWDQFKLVKPNTLIRQVTSIDPLIINRNLLGHNITSQCGFAKHLQLRLQL